MFNYVPIKHKQMSFVSNSGKFKLYTVLEIFSYLMAETKDGEMSQICIVSVKFLKDVRDLGRNAANRQ
jgi:hypothetical protein